MRPARRWPRKSARRRSEPITHASSEVSMRRPGQWVLGGMLIVSMPGLGLAQQNGVAIENAWSRASMAGRTGVVYLTITDTGAPDRLTSVASPAATTATLHESFTE